MLVLTRKIGQKLYFFDEAGNTLAEITVLDLLHTRVRLGVDADKKVIVKREELLDEAPQERT